MPVKAPYFMWYRKLHFRYDLFVYPMERIRPYALIKYSPAIPTKAYMIRDSHDMFPNKKAMRSNWKNPMSPQLTAPMITRVSKQ